MKKEIPILFSTPMVQANMKGRKTMTRRIMKPQPTEDWMQNTKQFSQDGRMYNHRGEQLFWISDGGDGEIKCPYGKPGDILWVKETFGELTDYCDHPEMPGCPTEHWSLGFKYRADNYEHKPSDGIWSGWKPSIHMPRAAARIFLEITDIRVERLQDISEEDAKAEGIERDEMGYRDYDKKLQQEYGHPDHDWPHLISPINSFKSLWRSINGEQSWKDNPWVWVVSFKVLSTTGNPQTKK